MERHAIKFKNSYKGKDYILFVEKPKDVKLSMYLGDYLFLDSLKGNKISNEMRMRYGYGGKLSDSEKEILKKCNILAIIEVREPEIFKDHIKVIR